MNDLPSDDFEDETNNVSLFFFFYSFPMKNDIMIFVWDGYP